MTAGEFLKMLRGDMAQNKAAEKIGCAQSFLVDIEKGRRYPSDEMLKRIVAAYKMTDEDIRIFKRQIAYENTPLIIREELDMLRTKFKNAEMENQEKN